MNLHHIPGLRPIPAALAPARQSRSGPAAFAWAARLPAQKTPAAPPARGENP